ncbi:MAG: leucine-rich repeat domain-containing protein, partial [Lachnospiraceae bacterium]|nr:leucine-rich repeat domain-containing protein [Lachnospiraceae bacterium]
MKKWLRLVLFFCILVNLDCGGIQVFGEVYKETEIIPETEENTEIQDTDFFEKEDTKITQELQEEELYKAESGLSNGDFQYQILDNGTIEITGYTGGETEVRIPSDINGRTVTSIGEFAFSNCKSIISLYIPESVTRIETAAFRDCSGITDLLIPGSVKSVGNGAFLWCEGINNLIISEGVEILERNAFEGCMGLRSLVIPESVTKIGKDTFYCPGLREITVKQGNANYDSRDNCNAIIETYSNKLIVGCENTKIPESVTQIEGLAFSGCKGLTSLRISKNVTKVSGFGGCIGLNQITVEEGNPVYDSRDNCNAIIETKSNRLVVGCKNTKIPKGVTTIGIGAFITHSNIIKMNIPDGV